MLSHKCAQINAHFTNCEAFALTTRSGAYSRGLGSKPRAVTARSRAAVHGATPTATEMASATTTDTRPKSANFFHQFLPRRSADAPAAIVSTIDL